jgi:outer membrane protein OmpA-like peptidoglycan-associated protein
MSGTEVLGRPGSDESTLSDPWLGTRLRVYGDSIDPFAVALSVDVTFPLAQAIIADQAYSGEQTVTFVPKLLMELRPWRFRLTANVGLRVREEYTSSVGALVRNDFLWRFGAGLDLYGEDEHHVEGIVEAYGNHALDFFSRDSTTNVELLFGVKYLSDGGLTAGLAAGPGLTAGWGTPAARVILTLGYIQPEPEPEPEPEGPTDTDGDGFDDDDDMCIEEPEDVDGFEDTDGCPDLDDDRDGIEDVDDECRLEPEDMDGFEDEDGCPDPDNDGDGIDDASDDCPTEAEDMDGFEDTDGCPDADNDGDGVPDVDDECPLAPGSAEANGCPQTIRLEGDRIRILQTIEFETNRAALLPTAEPILEEVRAVLAVNPQIARVRLEGHTDDRGPDARNLQLSRQRAESVRTWLTEHGLLSDRFEAWGCGETRPAEEGTTREARQANRRVEFHIVDPAHEGTPSTEGCEMAPAPEAQAEPEPSATP